MIKYDELKAKLLSDPEVQKEYEACSFEQRIAQALISARMAANMTQDQVV